MRFLIGWLCLGFIAGAVLVGIIVPTFGSDAGFIVEFIALIVYAGAFYGIFWGFGGEHGRLRA